MELLQEHTCFGGRQMVWRHSSDVLGCPMELAVYAPPGLSRPAPVVYFLSGLTCTWENFTAKAGAQRYSAEHGLVLVAPDTSPRGTDLPGEHDRYDFGSGAGFYVDATREPWSRHYRMYSYVTQELPELVAMHFPVDAGRQGIAGHSMGGHGALVCAFRNPERYRSVSAFAPVAQPSDVPWGQNAFSGYLGEDRKAWRDYDAADLALVTGWRSPVLIDVGSADAFLDEQLRSDRFVAACQAVGLPLSLRRQDGYDHSYYFVASFIGEHLAHHAKLLAD